MQVWPLHEIEYYALTTGSYLIKWLLTEPETTSAGDCEQQLRQAQNHVRHIHDFLQEIYVMVITGRDLRPSIKRLILQQGELPLAPNNHPDPYNDGFKMRAWFNLARVVCLAYAGLSEKHILCGCVDRNYKRYLL